MFCRGGRNGMGCFVRGVKNSMGCFVRGHKNSMGCFVRGGKSLWDVLCGVTKNGMGCFDPICFVLHSLQLYTDCIENCGLFWSNRGHIYAQQDYGWFNTFKRLGLTPSIRCLHKGPFVLIAVSHLSKTHFRDTLFACRVMLVAFLSSADFSQNQLFQRIL